MGWVSGRSGDRAAVPAAVSLRACCAGRYRLPAARGVSDGWPAAPDWSARDIDAAVDPGLRMQRSGVHGGADFAVAARPVHRERLGDPRPVLGAVECDLRAGGVLSGPLVGAGNLSAEYRNCDRLGLD